MKKSKELVNDLVTKKTVICVVVILCVILCCIIVSIIKIVGTSVEAGVSTLNSKVVTSLIVGVDVDNATDVVFEGSTEEIKQIEYDGKTYLGYVITREYPNYSVFGSKIVDNAANSNIFSGVSVSENIGVNVAEYTFCAKINKFDMALAENASLAVFEVTMPGERLSTTTGKVVNNTVSVDLLHNQNNTLYVNSVQDSPYAFFYTLLFICSLLFLILAIFLFILIILF